MACRTQRKTEALEAYEESGEDASAFVPDARCKRATLAFLLVMAVMLGYGLVVGAGASYAILVMMTASIVVGLVGGLSFQSSLTAMIQGGSKMFWMFFMFVLFEPFLNYVSASGAFDAVCQLMQPLIDVGGEVAFLMLSAAVGIFGISGTGVAQAQIIHELFLPMVQSLNIAMPIWGMVVLWAARSPSSSPPPLIWWDRWAWPAPRTSRPCWPTAGSSLSSPSPMSSSAPFCTPCERHLIRLEMFV